MNPSDLAAYLAVLREGGVRSFKGCGFEVELAPVQSVAAPQPFRDPEDAALGALMDLAGKAELP